MLPSEVIKQLQELPPDEEIVVAFWTRELFTGAVVDSEGIELPECPKQVWNEVVADYALQEWEQSAIWDDILDSVQDHYRNEYANEGDTK